MRASFLSKHLYPYGVGLLIFSLSHIFIMFYLCLIWISPRWTRVLRRRDRFMQIQKRRKLHVQPLCTQSFISVYERPFKLLKYKVISFTRHNETWYGLCSLRKKKKTILIMVDSSLFLVSSPVDCADNTVPYLASWFALSIHPRKWKCLSSMYIMLLYYLSSALMHRLCVFFLS